MQNKNKEDRYWAMRQVGLLTTVPVLLVVSPIVGFLIGQFIDNKFGTSPIFGIIFLIFGFIAGAQQVARVVKLANKKRDKEDA